MNKNYVEELRWRGMLQDMTPETESHLNEHFTTGYAGFDPTASSLHLGNLVPIMLLTHLQRCGHKPIALVGGATGMIGDPSGKSSERNLLSEEVLEENIKGVRKQLEKFLDFDAGEQSAEIVNNYDFYKDLSVMDFLREAGKHITISYMLAKDSVKNRLESGISFTEFSYQLFQGYDFYLLYQQRDCRLQIGGSDQWGNITTGTELIRRKSSGEAFALTCPLLTKADGSKFGKSEQGNIWLDPERTSPYTFYQFWLNVNDADLPRLFRFFSLKDKELIEGLEQEHANNPNALKRILAEEMTTRVHSAEDYQQALQASQLLYGKSTLVDFENTNDRTLQEVFDGVPHSQYSQAEYMQFATNIDLLAASFSMSKGEVRRMIKNNGLSINQEKVSVDAGNASPAHNLLKGRYLLLKKGRKFHLVEVKS